MYDFQISDVLQDLYAMVVHFTFFSHSKIKKPKKEANHRQKIKIAKKN